MSSKNYNEPTAIQNMLQAVENAAKRQCEQMDAGNYELERFTITIGGVSTEFILGGPQMASLFAFAEHIAAENFYEIKNTDGVITVEA